jgi:hypothetical protein
VLEGGLAVLQVEGGLAVLVLVLLSEVSVPRFSLSLTSLDPLRNSKLLLFRRSFSVPGRRSFPSLLLGLTACSRLPLWRSGWCWCRRIERPALLFGVDTHSGSLLIPLLLP